jgi:hypothetical protein
MEGFRLYFMHQLHEEINSFKNFRLRAKNPLNPNGYDSSQNDTNKMVLHSQMHDPSSQPSQLNAKYARKVKISNKTLKLRKLGKFGKNLHTSI